MNDTRKIFSERFPNDDACLAHLFTVRFGQGHVCPKCQRTAKWYRIKARPVYSCEYCGHHLRPMAGTMFQDSHNSLHLWFSAIHSCTTNRRGLSAKDLQRQLGVTYKCAWRMCLQIREHMHQLHQYGLLSDIMQPAVPDH